MGATGPAPASAHPGHASLLDPAPAAPLRDPIPTGAPRAATPARTPRPAPSAAGKWRAKQSAVRRGCPAALRCSQGLRGQRGGARRPLPAVARRPTTSAAGAASPLAHAMHPAPSHTLCSAPLHLPGLWLDPATKQCVPCVPGCLRCPGGVDTCDACGTGYTNVTGAELCAAWCAPRGLHLTPWMGARMARCGCAMAASQPIGLRVVPGTPDVCHISDPAPPPLAASSAAARRSTQEHCTTCREGEPDWCETCATFNAEGELQWGADPATGACVDCRTEHCARQARAAGLGR